MENIVEIMETGARYFPDDPAAAQRFDQLANEMGGENLRPQHAIMLADIVRGESLKEQLRADIAKRGMGEMAKNGRQTYWRENKSVATLMKLMDQQRRTLQALGLIAKDKNQPVTDDDEDDGFDRF